MKITFATLPVLILFSAAANATDLKPETLNAWRDYVESAKSRLQESLSARELFIPADKNSEVSARLQHGEVIVAPATQHTPTRVPSGLIHDWTANAFIPGVRVGHVLDVLRSYSEFKEFYRPTVIESRELESDAAGERFSIVARNKAAMSRTVETDYAASYTQVDEKRWYSIAQTTRIREIENYGQPDERKMGDDSDYIWRVYTIAKFEQRDGGVYVHFEAIALSRDIPECLHWAIMPMVKRLSRNSMTAFLTETRAAVLEKRAVTTKNSNSPANEGQPPSQRHLDSAFREK